MEVATIDLHVHTSCSDGDYTPDELIKYAASKGIKVLAIADHDTINAYTPNIDKLAEQYGVSLIRAIELSTVDRDTGQKIHVVGLNINTEDSELNKVCKEIAAQRREILANIADKLNKIGIKLRTNELLVKYPIITKSHIGHDVVFNPANRPFLIKKYGQVPLQGRFIEDYIIKGKPAFVENKHRLYTDEAVDIVKKVGGVSICAHPSFNVMNGFVFDNMKSLILRNGFDGVEAINVQYNKSDGDKQFDMVDEFSKFATQNGLLISGGSDFHSENTALWGQMSSIGLANEKYHVNDEMVKAILELKH